MRPEAFLNSLVRGLWADLQDPGFGRQLLVLGACLVLGWGATWLLTRLARGRARGAADAAKPNVAVATARGAMRRGLFPALSAAALALAMRLFEGHSTHVLHVAMVLMLALAAIRLMFHALSSLAPTRTIAAFERSLVVLVWLAVALYVTGYGEELRALLSAAELPIGRNHVSLWNLLSGGFWVLVTALVAVWLGGVLDARLQAMEAGDLAVRVVFGRIVRAALLLVALLIGLSIVGLDITALSVFGGAIGVGVGLGLQRIASNYISGFVVLLERRVRIGDTVLVDRFRGQVAEIRTRFTIVRSPEGWEAIVPNELLMTNPVQNFSQRQQLRSKTVLTLPYETDLAALAPGLLASIQAHPRVLAEPAASMGLTGMGPDGLTIELGYSIGEPDALRSSVQSEVNLAVWGLLRAQGILPARPHCEVSLVGAGTPA